MMLLLLLFPLCATCVSALASCPGDGILLEHSAGRRAFVCVSASSGNVTSLGDVDSAWLVAATSQIPGATIRPDSVHIVSSPTEIAVGRSWLVVAVGAVAVVEVSDKFTLGATGTIRWVYTVASAAAVAFPLHVLHTWDSTPFTEYWLASNTPGVSNASDPFAFLPLDAAHPLDAVYGGPVMAWPNGRLNGWTSSPRPPDAGTYSADGAVDGFSVPLLVLRPAAGAALGLMCDLTDMTTFLNISISGGGFHFERSFVRVGGNSTPLVFAMDAVTGPASDWRPFLGWAVDAYPTFFRRADNVDYSSIDGAVAYANYRGDTLNTTFLNAVGFQLNWDASFPFTYHGDYAPAAPDGSQADWFWACFAHVPPVLPLCTNTSHAQVRLWYDAMARAGFAMGSYGTFNEWGFGILDPDQSLPPYCASHGPSPLSNATAPAWATCHSNVMLRQQFPHAAIRDAFASGDPAYVYAGTGGSVGMDPADPAYLDHLLRMYARALRLAPEQVGLVVDRGDWCALFNTQRDDGYTWWAGGPAASLLNSFKHASAAVGSLFCAQGKAMLLNAHGFRMDLMAPYDGVYDEHGDDDTRRTAIGWMCSGGKVCSAWNHQGPENGMGYDLFLQQHLYMGLYPMVPFAGNDHAVTPGDALTDQAFLDYGALFLQLRGDRRMDLRAYPVTVLNVSSGDQPPKASLFQTFDPRGVLRRYVLVLAAGDASTASATVQMAYGLESSSTSTIVGLAFLPRGSRLGVSVSVQAGPGGAPPWVLKTPLSRGCAVVTLELAGR